VLDLDEGEVRGRREGEKRRNREEMKERREVWERESEGEGEWIEWMVEKGEGGRVGIVKERKSERKGEKGVSRR
jgi:hypothetical protein